jgi:hypothetical protein
VCRDCEAECRKQEFHHRMQTPCRGVRRHAQGPDLPLKLLRRRPTRSSASSCLSSVPWGLPGGLSHSSAGVGSPPAVPAPFLDSGASSTIFPSEHQGRPNRGLRRGTKPFAAGAYKDLAAF